LIEFPDLPGCLSDGETVEEAIKNGKEAVRCWIKAAEEADQIVPVPGKHVRFRSHH
jgi:antitoxin HicB